MCCVYLLRVDFVFFESTSEFITVVQDTEFESTDHFQRENVYAHEIAGNKRKKD